MDNPTNINEFWENLQREETDIPYCEEYINNLMAFDREKLLITNDDQDVLIQHVNERYED